MTAIVGKISFAESWGRAVDSKAVRMFRELNDMMENLEGELAILRKKYRALHESERCHRNTQFYDVAEDLYETKLRVEDSITSLNKLLMNLNELKRRFDEC